MTRLPNAVILCLLLHKVGALIGSDLGCTGFSTRSIFHTVSSAPALYRITSNPTLWQHGGSSSSITSFSSRRSRSTTLWGKGLNRARNKQGDLKKKLELAKKQKNNELTGAAAGDGAPRTLSPEEIQERNDRLRFEELLKRGSSYSFNDHGSDGYLTKEQEEEEIQAARAGVGRLFEGDPAPTDCFEELVSIKSENAIGKTGKERLVPWLHKNTARHHDYLVVLCDPRPKSPELRQTIQNLKVDLSLDIFGRLIVINADSPAENRRWLKKNNLEEAVDVYSDEKLQWMRAYTALGENRWSMTMFVLSDERVARLAREVDLYGVSRTIRNAINSLKEIRLS